MPEFHETRLGKEVYQGMLPRLVNALEGIERALKEQNRLARKAIGENPEDEEDTEE